MEPIGMIAIVLSVVGTAGLFGWMGYKYGTNRQADKSVDLFEEMNNEMLHLEEANIALQEKVIKLTPKPKRKYTRRKK